MSSQQPIIRIVPPQEPLPPPKPGVRHVHVPRRGVLIADDELRQHVRMRFHWPMIILAVMFLPLLALEFFVRPELFTGLWWVMTVGLAIVWLAFVVEFVVKVSIAESRFEYCKRNWLDIVIIMVPVLRPFRIAQVAKTARVFTLRGVGMKALRYVIAILLGLEFAEKLLQRMGLKAGDGRRDPAEMTRFQLMDEVKKLRRLTDAWAAWHEAHEAFKKDHESDARFADEPPHRAITADELPEPSRGWIDDPDDISNITAGPALTRPDAHNSFRAKFDTIDRAADDDGGDELTSEAVNPAS